MINLNDELKNITLSDEQLKKFEYYFNELVETNKVMNLTAITERDDVYVKHFLYSLYILNILNKDSKYTLCDVGSGAGFPGLPLAITDPNLDITIVDSLQKRINFLNSLFLKMGMSNIHALHARAEEYAIDHLDSFDIATARAVARLNILVELCLPLVKVGGKFIAMKSNYEEELEEAKSAISKLGGEIESIYDYDLPYDMGKRSLIIINKVKSTPKGYPRKFADIKKRPL